LDAWVEEKEARELKSVALSLKEPTHFHRFINDIFKSANPE